MNVTLRSHRFFSSTINLKSEFMNLDDIHKVHRLQTAFEKDPTNSKNAHELFKVRFNGQYKLG